MVNLLAKNLGLALEKIIEQANKIYAANEEAIIQKIATPWKVVRKFDPIRKKKIIVAAFPEEKSTVDYGGTAKGRSIWYDAKSTQNKTSFPLANLKRHQVNFLNQVERAGGIAFWLIYSEQQEKAWILYQSQLRLFQQQHKRKSIPFEWLNVHCSTVKATKDNNFDYLREVFLIERPFI